MCSFWCFQLKSARTRTQLSKTWSIREKRSVREKFFCFVFHFSFLFSKCPRDINFNIADFCVFRLIYSFIENWHRVTDTNYFGRWDVVVVVIIVFNRIAQIKWKINTQNAFELQMAFGFEIRIELEIYLNFFVDFLFDFQ